MNNKYSARSSLRIFYTGFATMMVLASTAAGVYYWSINNYPLQPQGSTYHLADYRITQSRLLDNAGEELSGLTYSDHNQLLYAVNDSPAQIIELSLEGDVQRIILLQGFSDTEAITHIRNNMFAISQENKHSIAIIDIDGSTRSIDSNSATHIPLSGINYRDPRKGPEAIAWSEQLGLLVGNEQKPTLISQILLDEDWQFFQLNPTFLEKLPLKDIAGLTFDPVTKHPLRLMVLSDESRRILEIDTEGKIYSQLKLTEGFFDRHYLVEQPEGLAMDENQNLYIIGEPNHFLRLQKPTLEHTTRSTKN